jgi:hypothetical protein
MLEHAPNTDGEVLDDEVVIIRPSSSAREPKIFQPHSGVRFPSVLGDIGGWLKAQQEWCFLDAALEGPWARGVRTRAPVTVSVTRSATTPGGASSSSSGWWASTMPAAALATSAPWQASSREWMTLCVVVGSSRPRTWGVTQLEPGRDAVRPQRRDLPGVEALATSGPRGLAAASLTQQLGRRSRAECCDGAPAARGPQARAGCVRAS